MSFFAKVAHAHSVPLIVDNTFPTPVNCRPIEWGADIVTHSTTKIYGRTWSKEVGGAIVDSGNFDWMAHADKYPGLCTPDESYHGITYAEKFGKEGAFITKCTAQLMRDLGSIQAPQNAFILNLGLESLHVRMPRHVENGQAVAEFLSKAPKRLLMSIIRDFHLTNTMKEQRNTCQTGLWSGIFRIERWKRSRFPYSCRI